MHDSHLVSQISDVPTQYKAVICLSIQPPHLYMGELVAEYCLANMCTLMVFNKERNWQCISKLGQFINLSKIFTRWALKVYLSSKVRGGCLLVVLSFIMMNMYCTFSMHWPYLFVVFDIYQGPLLLTWINFNLAWLCNHIHYKVVDEITYPFENLNGASIQVYEWISNSIPHFTRQVITYPCWD